MTLFSKSRCHLEGLAERPALARLWEGSAAVGTYGGAARDHPPGASCRLWVLGAAPRECPDGLVGHFCRSISWGEEGGQRGEQRGDGTMWPRPGAAGQRGGEAGICDSLLARRRVQMRTSTYESARSPWGAQQHSAGRPWSAWEVAAGVYIMLGKAGSLSLLQKKGGCAWVGAEDGRLSVVMPTACPEADIHCQPSSLPAALGRRGGRRGYGGSEK